MNKLRVSKTLVNDWWKYKEQEKCGELFRLQHVERAEMPEVTNEAMAAGQRFEYQCLGSLLRDGSVPPVLTGVNGKSLAIQNVIDVQTDRWKKFAEENKITTLASGLKLEVDMGRYTLVGVLDGLIEYDGVLCILEQKFTSLLNNDNSAFKVKSKYAYDPETIQNNPIHMIQPILYVVLLKTHPQYKVSLPFFYYIASSKQLYNSEFIEVEVTDDAITDTLNKVDEIVNEIEGMVELEMEFEVYSDANKCSKCPAFTICTKKIVSPNIRRVKV